MDQWGGPLHGETWDLRPQQGECSSLADGPFSWGLQQRAALSGSKPLVSPLGTETFERAGA